MELTFTEKKYWWVETRSTIPCAFTNDGQMCMFFLKDVEEILNKKYPKEGKVWFFNQTLDREIAEVRDDKALCNPQVYWRHFKI